MVSNKSFDANKKKRYRHIIDLNKVNRNKEFKIGYLSSDKDEDFLSSINDHYSEKQKKMASRK